MGVVQRTLLYYAQLVAQAPDEWLVRVRQRFGLTDVVVA